MKTCSYCGFLNQYQAANCANCRQPLVIESYTPAKGTIPQKLRLAPGNILQTPASTYTVQQEIGSGGFGTVYLVHDNLNREFAVKILHLWEIHPKDHEEVMGRFTREYEAGKVASPFIVQSINRGQCGGNPFIVMEYCPNGDLRQKMNRHWDEPSVNRVAGNILMGLHQLHSSGIIHRDLKPENILFGKEHIAMLSDFGISGFLQNRSTRADWRGHVKNVFGTVVYMPPEQLDVKTAFRSVAPATDIFGFGVLMYELLTQGKLPFGDFEEFTQNRQLFFDKVKKGQLTPPQTYRQNLSNNWITILGQCLHPDPSKRFGSALELLRYIPASQTISPPNPPQTPPKPVTKNTLTLQIMNGDEYGRQYHLSQLLRKKGKSILTLGWYDKQNPYDNDIPIVENYTKYISRYHATLEYAHNKWYIRDGQWRCINNLWQWKKSKNGTLVNSQTVTINGQPIYHNDIITVGDTT
ncbi:hypothetical protein C7N43_38790, partial [Sphingobacteriales bacterium UPWRP_1]